MRYHLPGKLILILLTAILSGPALDSMAQKKAPYPPTDRPPYPIDQPRAPLKKAEPTYQKAEPTQAIEQVELPAEPLPEPPAKRNKLPGYIVFLGIILLFLRKVPSGKK